MKHLYIFRLLGHAKLSITERYIAQGSRKRLLEAYDRGVEALLTCLCAIT